MREGSNDQCLVVRVTQLEISVLDTEALIAIAFDLRRVNKLGMR